MKRKLVLFALGVILVSPTFAQVKAVSVTGDSVLLYDDFTWKPIIKEKPKPEAPTPIVLIGSVNTTVDESSASGKTVIHTEEWKSFGLDNDKTPLSGFMQKKGDTYSIMFSFAGDIGCLSKEQSYLRIRLNNGMTIECKQISETSCGDSRSAEFVVLSEEQLNAAASKKVMDKNIDALVRYDWQSIRIYGSTFFADIKPSKSKANKEPEQFFRQHISAIMRAE